ncbi:MAG: hypothetical protein U5Q44_03460 [Dehalococcoidia bacterium]|nr:hypothetical protein [Dehalococcoidia bacterium]
MSGELTMNSDELVDDIRAVTGQSSEPATEDAEGADIDWIGTVVPVTAGVVIVLGIGLVLMKEWHRIDPS